MKVHFSTATKIIGIPDPASKLRLQRPRRPEWEILKEVMTPAKTR